MTDRDKEAVLLRIYVREGEQWQGKPLHEAIIAEAMARGLAGATVLRGIAGSGLRSPGQADEAGSPLVIEIVDWEGKAQAFAETAREMVEEGLMTMEKVDVAWYQSRMP